MAVRMRIDGETAPYTSTFLARHAGSSTTHTKDASFCVAKICIHSSTSTARWNSDTRVWVWTTRAAREANFSSRMMGSSQKSINTVERSGGMTDSAHWNGRKPLRLWRALFVAGPALGSPRCGYREMQTE